MITYGIVGTGTWRQEHYETASRDAGKRARELRALGYAVVVSGLGLQVTPVGLVKMTMVTIRPQPGQDYLGRIPDVERGAL